MQAQQKGRGRANALKGELTVRLEEASRAPAEAVYDLLADIGSHLEWGGRRQPRKSYRLLSIDGPDGPATIGTEFRSTGADAMGEFADSSVVTEATRPGLFEFVTEARLSTKKGKVVEWTNVHRYEIAAQPDGCRITYTVRILRISELPGRDGRLQDPGPAGAGSADRRFELTQGAARSRTARRGARERALRKEEGRWRRHRRRAPRTTSQMEGFEGHYAELGGTTVGWETYTADADLTPLFVGLPDDRCQCEHWGYVFEGKLVFHTADGDEEFVGGDAYSVGPGHTPSIFAGTSLWSSAQPTG